jgi:lipopolysaccharide export LptBFGC system permease protein LptF
MILFSYLTRRYLSYFFTVNCALTLMYNFIEFVEKLIRFKPDSASSITMFILLNLLPTFFDFIHLSAWLSLCLLLWEMHQRGEWESIQLLGVHPRAIARILLKAGVFLTLLSFVGKEFVIFPFVRSSQEYKNKNLKTDQNKKLFGQWVLNDESFVGFDFFDVKKQEGTNLTLLAMNDSFGPTEKIECETFSCNDSDQTIFLKSGTRFNFEDNTKTLLENTTLHLPSLFAHLKLHLAYPSLQQQFKNIIIAASMTSHFPLNQELGKLFSRLLLHLQPIIYILITIGLFFFLPYHPRLQWPLILTPYPILLILTSMGDFLLQLDFFAAVVLIPYAIAFFIIWTLFRLSYS